MDNRDNSAAQFPTPKWDLELRDKYKTGVAHGFILHFNIADMVQPGKYLKSYLARFQRDIICYYNQVEGITFALPTMREKTLAALGYQQAPPAGGGALAAALGVANNAGGSGGGVTLPKGPSQALPLLQRLLEEVPRVVVIIDHAEYIAPNATPAMMGAEDRASTITIEGWGHNNTISTMGNMVILVVNRLEDLNQAVRDVSSKYEAIEIATPESDTRKAYINHYLDLIRREHDENPTARPAVTTEISVEQLTSATSGLRLVDIEDVFLRAKRLGALTMRLVRERKRDIIRTSYPMLEWIDTNQGFEAIGGQEHIKTMFRRKVIGPLSSGNLRRVPHGILLLGPPGTGKTMIAKALGHEAGYNFVKLDPSNILGSLVGQSENNMKLALRAILGLAPTFVFIDEIEQWLQRGRQGDSGVSSNIFKSILEFMSDPNNRGKVIFIAATNRPDMLDSALKRAGRFGDLKLMFGLPGDEERVLIIKVLAISGGLTEDDIAVADEVIAATKGWSGADLESLVTKSLEIVEDEGESAAQALLMAAQRIRPSTGDGELMLLMAAQEISDTDAVPPEYRSLLDDRSLLNSRVKQMESGTRGEARDELLARTNTPGWQMSPWGWLHRGVLFTEAMFVLYRHLRQRKGKENVSSPKPDNADRTVQLLPQTTDPFGMHRLAAVKFVNLQLSTNTYPEHDHLDLLIHYYAQDEIVIALRATIGISSPLVAVWQAALNHALWVKLGIENATEAEAAVRKVSDISKAAAGSGQTSGIAITLSHNQVLQLKEEVETVRYWRDLHEESGNREDEWANATSQLLASVTLILEQAA